MLLSDLQKVSEIDKRISVLHHSLLELYEQRTAILDGAKTAPAVPVRRRISQPNARRAAANLS